MPKSKAIPAKRRSTCEIQSYRIILPKEYRHFRFLVPSLCKQWVRLKEMEESGEIAFKYPKSQNPRAGLGLTKEMMDEMTFQFELDPDTSSAIFEPSMDDPEMAKFLAQEAYKAALFLGPDPATLPQKDENGNPIKRKAVVTFDRRGLDPFDEEPFLPSRKSLQRKNAWIKVKVRDEDDDLEERPVLGLYDQ